MDQREQQSPEQDVAPQPRKAGGDTEGAATTKAIDHHPGGKDALGKKENLLAPFYDDMVAVANELAPQFTPLGLHFRPEILLATAMQEAANKDPLNNRSFDNGLGIMQITPYKGKLDPAVAKSIGWNNSLGIEENIRSSNWRSARANLTAGAHTMIGKAKAIKRGVPQIWEQMDEPHRWRAVLFAYNAGEGAATKALKAGGPNAAMISTFTNKQGKRVSHDYTAEIKAKMDYVDAHDPFAGGGETPTSTSTDQAPDQTPDTKTTTTGQGQTTPGDQAQDTHKDEPAFTGKGVHDSVGRGGVNKGHDVRKVQHQLKARGIDPGKTDGRNGPHTIHAIEAFQATFLHHPDGLIEPGKASDQHLFGSTGQIPAGTTTKQQTETRTQSKDPGGKQEEQHTETTTKPEEAAHPTYDAIAKNFNTAIPGSSLTWHQALYLPSWGRHAKPSDMTNAPVDTVLANIQKQAVALQKVADHFGKAIHVHCWLRPPKYNSQIGGAGNSAHLRGTATDFHFEGLSAEQVRKALKDHPDLYPGTGENNVSWAHIDLEHHRWFNP